MGGRGEGAGGAEGRRPGGKVVTEAGGGESREQQRFLVLRRTGQPFIYLHLVKRACAIDWSTPLSCFTGFQKDSLLPC